MFLLSLTTELSASASAGLSGIKHTADELWSAEFHTPLPKTFCQAYVQWRADEQFFLRNNLAMEEQVSIEQADALNAEQIIVSLSDGRALVLTLAQILSAAPTVFMADSPYEDSI